MSLNGLDDAAITEAYTGALGEAGGWFLLKYASRDSVEIHTRGTGGAAEVRAAIQGYEEKSPLYGFLLYRRRRVLVKYVPEGTSRLLQARVAVHFTAITEKFAPHDTTLSIATADELSNAALTSACSLHTAQAVRSSSSSSCSSRKQKLDEITEDVEDGQATAGASEAAAPVNNTPEENTKDEGEKGEIVAVEPENTGASEPVAKPSTDASTDEVELARTQTAPGTESFRRYDALFENGPDPRSSSQTARPDLAELYAEIYAQYNKPKVKLGPRPKASLDGKRPYTSENNTGSTAKPVSSLPPGLRASNRRNVEPKRPKSRDASTVPSIAVPPPPPIPTSPEIPISPLYPRSPASVRSLPMNTYSSLSYKSPKVTPEKQRLMKALQMRKKQMEAKKIHEEKQAEAAAEDTGAGAEKDARDVVAADHEPSTMVLVGADTGSAVSSTPADALSRPRTKEDTAERQPQETDASKTAPPQEESEIGMPPTRTDTDDMHSAASASSPTSAQTQGSSVAPSTRPSSISEDESDVKAETVSIPPKQIEEASLENEEVSPESTPTVVPETVVAIPQVEVSSQPDKQREGPVLMSSTELEDARASRRSKRESMVFSMSSDSKGQGRSSEGLTVDPTHLNADSSEAEYLSDDSFMEELQSAKVEEAMPVDVSKSPMNPFFSRKPSSPEITTMKRSVSQQHTRLGPETPGPRKLSGPWLTQAKPDPVVAKKVNVSSGISQRIKALAEKSNRESSASLSPVLSSNGTPSSLAQRKSSFFSTPPDGNSPNASTNRISRASFINVSRSTTPEPKPSVQAPPATAPATMTATTSPKPQAVYNVQQEAEQPESVQVTARIVREEKPPKPTLTMPTESSPLELHQSPIIIDHQKSTRPATAGSRTSPIKTEPTSPRPASSTQSIEPAANLPRSSSESSWRSFGRRLSETKNPAPPRSMSAHSFDVSSGDEKSAKKEKKDSRTSKLFKRMSSISSITRKNSVPNIPEDIPSTPLPSLREPPSAVQVGDLNIQLPDSLLWKRRWVEIDASGNIILSLSKSNERSKGITRRFNLTEFRAPYAPDLDSQELPNSVVLDFLDGRTLQLACETYTGQTQVLQTLFKAHTAWATYNQGL